MVLISSFSKIYIKLCILILVTMTTFASCGGGDGDDSDPSSPSGGIESSDLRIDFDKTVVDHFKDKVLTLRNNSNEVASIGEIAQKDSLGMPFSIVEDSCSNQSLNPSGTCSLTVQFLPSEQGLFTDTFDISADDSRTLMTIGVSGESFALNVSINQVDKSTCPGVRLFVSVTDSQDVPVTALTQDDFLIYEDGELQNILNISNNAVTPVSVVLALDSSNSEQSFISDIQSAAKSFLGVLDLDNGTDEAEIIKFAATIETKQLFTDNETSLLDSVDAAYTGLQNETHLYDAVWQAVDSATSPSRNDKRAVIVLTDGRNEGSTDHEIDEVSEKANESGVPVFTIGLGDVFSAPLQYLSDGTGGQFFLAPTSADLEDIYLLIAEILTNQYVIEYESSSAGGELIDLDIEVNQNGLNGEGSKSVNGCN